MMPLNLALPGEENIIRKIGGSQEVKKHLEDLGFVPGAEISVVSSHEGDMIISLKEARLAVTREMAGKIMVQN